MIQIKSPDILKHYLHPNLYDVLTWLLEWWPASFIITSLHREGMTIHNTEPLRAMDVRSFDFSKEASKLIEERINNEWVYDPQRPAMKVCLWHDVGRGEHFHVQVHDRTIRRDKQPY